MGNLGVGELIVIIVIIVVIAFLREFLCWYWKINEGINILKRIETKLSSIAEEFTKLQK